MRKNIYKIKMFLFKIKESLFYSFYKDIKRFPFAGNFGKGLNHLFDVIVEENRNDNFIIFDVGANVGQSALFYCKYLNDPIIYCFEPVNSTYAILLKNIIGHKNVKPFNYALGSKNGKINIQLSPDPGLNSLIPSVFNKINTGQRQEIVVKTIDDIMEEQGLSRIDLLKIDTEGFDLEVLKGANKFLSTKSIEYVYCEVGFYSEPDKGDFFEIKNLFQNYGYCFCGFYDPVRWGRNYTYYAFSNALFKVCRE